jgi:hypothetical protein
MNAQVGDWLGTDMLDMRGKAFKVGDRVARAIRAGMAVNLEIATVTRIDDGKLYLNDSKVAINYPGRMLIVSEILE